MNIFIKFECDIKILKPTNGVYCEETKDGWLYTHPDKYRVEPSNFRRVVRNFLDDIYFSDSFTGFVGVVRVKTDKYFGERFVDIKIRDRGGEFYHSMDIEYNTWEGINKVLKKFDYKENFKADITIDLRSN